MPQILCYIGVSKRAPTPAVTPMANAPQNSTRAAPSATLAPPTRAATDPRRPSCKREMTAIAGMTFLCGAIAAVDKGRTAPTVKLAAEATGERQATEPAWDDDGLAQQRKADRPRREFRETHGRVALKLGSMSPAYSSRQIGVAERALWDIRRRAISVTPP